MGAHFGNECYLGVLRRELRGHAAGAGAGCACRTRARPALEPEPEPEPAAEEPLPDGWEARVSSSTGETYFFNTMTQESEWDRPTTGAQRP